MPRITFAHTRHYYESYRDFWTLVKLCGFQTCFVDEVDPTAHNQIYITTMVGDEWKDLMERFQRKPRRAHCILWNLERPLGWAGSMSAYSLKCWRMIHERWFDAIWVSDRRLAEETELDFIILGSHPDLGDPSNAGKKYDFCHMSYLTNRRQSIYKNFPAERIAPNCWPPERHEVLRASKFAFNVHQDVHPFQEPLRFALFAAYALPILSEDIYDSFPWSDATMIWSSYPGLVPKMEQMLENAYPRWMEMGLRGNALLCNTHRFDKEVHQKVGNIP